MTLGKPKYVIEPATIHYWSNVIRIGQHVASIKQCYLKDGVFTEVDEALELSFLAFLVHDVVQERTLWLL